MVMVSGSKAFGAAALLLGLSACASSQVGPPSNTENACTIVTERSDWYEAARNSAKKWKAPTPVILAIIWRESSFRPDAQTPREYALGVVPWGRQSSAYGFAQAIDGTWEWYQDDHGGDDADRENFADAADFVGWYMNKTRKKLGVKTSDARQQYLAYHEGHGGFRTGKWRQKAFLVKASRQVARMAARYDAQLRGCDAEYARERSRGLAKTPMPQRPPFALSSVSGISPVAKPSQVVPASARAVPKPRPEKPDDL